MRCSDSKRHLSILAVPAHLAFQWHLKFIIASFILDCKQTKVADDSLFPFCRCQKVRTDDTHNLPETQSLQLQKKCDVLNCFLTVLLKIWQYMTDKGQGPSRTGLNMKFKYLWIRNTSKARCPALHKHAVTS